jgi:uncharacterized protein (DUF1501 family)
MINKIIRVDCSTGEQTLADMTTDEQQAYDAMLAELQEHRNDGIRIARQQAFQVEADPLFFAWQRGENSEQAWIDKVAEIRARYPYTA